MPNTFRGKAQVSGSKITVDVILYPIANSLELTQNWDEDILKDEIGDDYAVRAHNEKYEGDLGMIAVDKSSTSLIANAQTGAAFLTPLTTCTITTCLVAAWNSTYQLMPGNKIAQGNDTHGKISYRLRKWADSTQNTLMQTTPG